MSRRVPAILSVTLPALVVALGASRAGAQGDNGFLRGTGKTDVSLSYSYDTYDKFWVGSHKVEDPAVGRITREAVNLYAAYGIDAKTDLVVNASWVDVESDGINAGNANKDQSALQDASIGLKYRLNDWHLGPGGLSLLFAPAVKIPMSHYENNAITAIGDGQIDYRFRGILQYTAECGAFLAVESGYDYRTESTPNEVPFNVTLGAPITRYVVLTPFFSLVKSYGNDNIGQVPFPAVQEEYRLWGVSAYVRANEKLGFTVGYKDTITGRNTGDVTGYWIGVVFKL